MRKNRFTLPIVFASIGALINIVVSYFIAYFATGGAFMNGKFTFDFGDMWCSNLTDKNGPYIELMTGVYTDNQPDFTWVMPYETRTFDVGDRSADMWRRDPQTGAVMGYTGCAISLIEV